MLGAYLPLRSKVQVTCRRKPEGLGVPNLIGAADKSVKGLQHPHLIGTAGWTDVVPQFGAEPEIGIDELCKEIPHPAVLISPGIFLLELLAGLRRIGETGTADNLAVVAQGKNGVVQGKGLEGTAVVGSKQGRVGNLSPGCSRSGCKCRGRY